MVDDVRLGAVERAYEARVARAVDAGVGVLGEDARVAVFFPGLRLAWRGADEFEQAEAVEGGVAVTPA